MHTTPWVFEIPLGHGRFGTVWKARTTSGHPIVLRELTLSTSQFAPILHRLERLRDIDHLGLGVNYAWEQYQHGCGQEVLAIWRPYITGSTLAARCPKNSVNHGETVFVAQKLATYLQAIHQAGYTHGDISTQNVLLTSHNELVVIDAVLGVFGAGTPDFTAPERNQATADTVLPASDIWAWGAIVSYLSANIDALPRLADLVNRTQHSDPACRPTAAELCEFFAINQLAASPIGQLPQIDSVCGRLRQNALAPTQASATSSSLTFSAKGKVQPVKKRRCGAHRAGHKKALRISKKLLASAWTLCLLLGGAYWVKGVLEPAPRATADVSTAAHTSNVSHPAAAPSHVLIQSALAPAGMESLPAPHVCTDIAALWQQRDAAFNTANASALAKTTVPNSPAQQADATYVTALRAGSLQTTGLNTQVLSAVPQVSRIELVASGLVTCLVNYQQSSYTRTYQGHTENIAASPARKIYLTIHSASKRIYAGEPVSALP